MESQDFPQSEENPYHKRSEGRWWLMPKSTDHMPIEVDMELEVGGIVTHVIHATT